MKRIDILILTRDRVSTVKKCLDHIGTQRYPLRDVSLIVFDDASSDATPREVPGYLRGLQETCGFRSTLFLRSEQNTGVAASRNALVRHLSPDADYVLFLDDDVYLSPDTLSVLAGHLDAHPGTGIVGPRVVLADNPGKVVQAAVFINRWTGRYSILRSTGPVSCDCVDPLCILLPADALRKTGGFSEDYYRSHEGIDFCLKVREAGYTVDYQPGTTVRHDTRPSYPSLERIYYLYRNKLIVIHRHFKGSRKLFALGFALVNLPLYLLRSVRLHRKVSVRELQVICIAVAHGVRGITGKRPE